MALPGDIPGQGVPQSPQPAGPPGGAGPPSAVLAGPEAPSGPDPAVIGQQVQEELIAIQQFVEALIAQFPQAEQRGSAVLEGLTAMGQDILSTLQPQPGAIQEPPPMA